MKSQTESKMTENVALNRLQKWHFFTICLLHELKELTEHHLSEAHFGMCTLVHSKFLLLCTCVQMTLKDPNIHFGLQISYSIFAIMKSTNNEDQLYAFKIFMLDHPAKIFSNWLRNY